MMKRVRCCQCGQPMDAIYCPSIREACDPCGGVSLAQPGVTKTDEELAQQRREAARERKRQTPPRAGTLTLGDLDTGKNMSKSQRRRMAVQMQDGDDDGPRAA